LVGSSKEISESFEIRSGSLSGKLLHSSNSLESRSGGVGGVGGDGVPVLEGGEVGSGWRGFGRGGSDGDDGFLDGLGLIFLLGGRRDLAESDGGRSSGSCESERGLGEEGCRNGGPLGRIRRRRSSSSNALSSHALPPELIRLLRETLKRSSRDGCSFLVAAVGSVVGRSEGHELSRRGVESGEVDRGGHGELTGSGGKDFGGGLSLRELMIEEEMQG